MRAGGFTLPSFAKINLYLEIIGKRPDGYHELSTVFQTVSLCDRITFEPADGLRLRCTDASIPTGESNLILKAAHKLRERSGFRGGAAIFLEKHIPSPGGLGGGSSNAAVALIGLSRLWNVDIGVAEMQELATELGSDVPFFLYGGTAFGKGRGDIIEPAADARCPNILIVTPDIAVSTPDAFARIRADSLTNTDANRILLNCRFESDAFDTNAFEFRNDLEAAVFSAYPEIEQAKQKLLELGADTAGLSGSGASVFALFEKEETRQAALEALDERINWRKFAVAAISRDRYREALGK